MSFTPLIYSNFGMPNEISGEIIFHFYTYIKQSLGLWFELVLIVLICRIYAIFLQNSVQSPGNPVLFRYVLTAITEKFYALYCDALYLSLLSLSVSTVRNI